MAAIDRRIFLRSILPGAVVAAVGVTAISTATLSVAGDAAATPPGANRTPAPKACEATERAPTDISAQPWRRRRRRQVRRRVRRCWWRRGRRVCGWRWIWV